MSYAIQMYSKGFFIASAPLRKKRNATCVISLSLSAAVIRSHARSSRLYSRRCSGNTYRSVALANRRRCRQAHLRIAQIHRAPQPLLSHSGAAWHEWTLDGTRTVLPAHSSETRAPSNGRDNPSVTWHSRSLDSLTSHWAQS